MSTRSSCSERVAPCLSDFPRDGLIDRLRGEGLIVAKGARDSLLKRERARFFKDEWPSLRERLRRLGIDMRALAESTEDK